MADQSPITARRQSDKESTQRPRSIVVLHGTNYWNIGDLGLMVATIESLKAKMPDAKITVLTQFGANERPDGQSFDISELGVQELEWLTTPRATRWKKLRGPLLMVKGTLTALLILLLRSKVGGWLRRLPLGPVMAADQMLRADVIVSKPGGFFYGYSAIPGPHHMIHFYLASLCRRPLVIYGQSIGPFSERVNFPLVRRVLGKADAILVRDETSREICFNKLDLEPKKVILTADEAFRFHQTRDESSGQTEPGHLRVGMTLINWHFPGQSYPDETRRKYLAAMKALTQHVLEKHNASIDLFSFLRAHQDAPGDEGVSKEFARELESNSRIKLHLPNDPRQVKRTMHGVDVFVGSRMHSNIFALGEGIPVLAIAYQHKTTSIMSMAGLSDYVLDINTLRPEPLCEMFDRLVENRLELAQTVRSVVDNISARADGNAEITRAIAYGDPIEVPSRPAGGGSTKIHVAPDG